VGVPTCCLAQILFHRLSGKMEPGALAPISSGLGLSWLFLRAGPCVPWCLNRFRFSSFPPNVGAWKLPPTSQTYLIVGNLVSTSQLVVKGARDCLPNPKRVWGPTLNHAGLDLIACLAIGLAAGT